MGSDDLDWLDEAGFIFQTPVHAKKGRQRGPKGSSRKSGVPALLGRIQRVTQRRPEVMVKVSGSARGRKHLREHLSYITRNGEIVGEREDGTTVDGGEAVRDMAADWWEMRDPEGRRNARETINLVLSMPAGTDRERLAEAASAFARAEFGGQHDYVLAHHTDTEHPHAHLTVKTVGYRGQHLNPRKADLQQWREGFAEQLRFRGVQAEATPRRARGQVQKGTRQAIRHMDKTQRSRVSRWKIEQAIKTARAGQGDPNASVEPWRAAIQERQRKTRKAWSTIASALDGMGEVALAVQVQQFAAGMPVDVVTARDALLQQVQERLEKALEREQTPKRR